jgi:hypothetical protein
MGVAGAMEEAAGLAVVSELQAASASKSELARKALGRENFMAGRRSGFCGRSIRIILRRRLP